MVRDVLPWRALDRLKARFEQAAPGELVTNDDLFTAVWGHGPVPEWALKIIGILIHRARKQGFPIVTVRGYTRAPRR